MRSVARRYHFVAEHSVSGLGERWAKPHWHEYTVEVVCTLEGGGRGVIIDTDVLDARWEEQGDLQGANLNAVIGGDTTVEALAAHWLEWFAPVLTRRAEVSVWEDDDRWGRVTTDA